MTVKSCHTVRRVREKRYFKRDASKAELSQSEMDKLFSKIESVPTQDTSVSDPFLNNVSKRLVADMPVYFNTALGASFNFAFGSLDKITYESFLHSVSNRTIMTFAKWGNKNVLVEVDSLLFGAIYYRRMLHFLHEQLVGESEERNLLIKQLISEIEEKGFHEFTDGEILEMQETVTKPVLQLLYRAFTCCGKTNLPDYSEIKTVQYPSLFQNLLLPQKAGIALAIESAINGSSGFINIFMDL